MYGKIHLFPPMPSVIKRQIEKVGRLVKNQIKLIVGIDISPKRQFLDYCIDKAGLAVPHIPREDVAIIVTAVMVEFKGKDLETLIHILSDGQ